MWAMSAPLPSYFYPRSPCGERRKINNAYIYTKRISIHALLTESDTWHWRSSLSKGISIHALLAESDRLPTFRGSGRLHFYPRSPCGERRYVLIRYRIRARYFYPRSPCGERPYTRTQSASLVEKYFYPRSPCGERRSKWKHTPKRQYFYPRSPCGERRDEVDNGADNVIFLSTLSLRRATPAGL